MAHQLNLYINRDRDNQRERYCSAIQNENSLCCNIDLFDLILGVDTVPFELDQFVFPPPLAVGEWKVESCNKNKEIEKIPAG